MGDPHVPLMEVVETPQIPATSPQSPPLEFVEDPQPVTYEMQIDDVYECLNSARPTNPPPVEYEVSAPPRSTTPQGKRYRSEVSHLQNADQSSLLEEDLDFDTGSVMMQAVLKRKGKIDKWAAKETKEYEQRIHRSTNAHRSVLEADHLREKTRLQQQHRASARAMEQEAEVAAAQERASLQAKVTAHIAQEQADLQVAVEQQKVALNQAAGSAIKNHQDLLETERGMKARYDSQLAQQQEQLELFRKQMEDQKSEMKSMFEQKVLNLQQDNRAKEEKSRSELDRVTSELMQTQNEYQGALATDHEKFRSELAAARQERLDAERMHQEELDAVQTRSLEAQRQYRVDLELAAQLHREERQKYLKELEAVEKARQDDRLNFQRQLDNLKQTHSSTGKPKDSGQPYPETPLGSTTPRRSATELPTQAISTPIPSRQDFQSSYSPHTTA